MKETIKLKPSVKKLWLKALRSGKYEQGTQSLVQELDDGNYSFCCLGVLQNEYCLKHNETFEENDFDLGIITNYKVLDWAFTENSECSKTEHRKLIRDCQNTLAEFNDENRWNFKQLAAWIDATY